MSKYEHNPKSNTYNLFWEENIIKERKGQLMYVLLHLV